MATMTKAISKDLLDSVLPTYGTPRAHFPAWDNNQKMFICDQYESASGHLYYRGIRFCDRIVIVEKVGLYHNWTYIDGIELYVFNGKKLELIQKRDYDKVFRDEDFVRSESENMVKDYLCGIQKVLRTSIPVEEIELNAKSLIEGCYKSYLEHDFNTRLTQILPAIEQK
ncbi:MAG: hypothetical protein IJS43_06770 [Bacteroidaceae bacterium]|nr:hypothetical protein [Bacteroidaceae bacterium]